MNSTANISRIKSAKQDGFNLIEVTLAVAIVGVGVLAVMGMLPVGLEASRRVSDDTIINTIVGDMFNWRRVTPYSSISWFPYNAPALTTTRPSTPVVTIFDAMGNLPKDEYDHTNPYYGGDYFKVSYTILDHPDFAGATDIARVLVTVEWPVNAPAAKQQRRYFLSQFSNTRT